MFNAEMKLKRVLCMPHWNLMPTKLFTQNQSNVVRERKKQVLRKRSALVNAGALQLSHPLKQQKEQFTPICELFTDTFPSTLPNNHIRYSKHCCTSFYFNSNNRVLCPSQWSRKSWY